MNRSQNPAAVQIARRIESMMDDVRPAADSDPALALASLMLALHDVIDELDAMPSVPPIRGGGHDDFEELCPEFLNDPQGWPAFPDPECDGHRWTTEPTPVEVLAAEAPTGAFVPTAEDWNDYAAWCESEGYGVSERDLAAAGLAVG